MIKKDFYLNQQELVHHAKNPANFGLKPDLDFVSGEYNPSCGDRVVFGGNIVDGLVKQVCFEGSGCVISMAMASKLTQAVVGMNFEQIEQLDEQIVQQLLGMQLGLTRLKCGLLSVMALQKGIKSHLSSSSDLIRGSIIKNL